MSESKCNYKKEKFKSVFLLSSLLFILIILSFLSLSYFATAELNINTYDVTYDFSANLDTNINMCGCAGYINQVILKNTGNFDSNFYLTSSNPDLINFKVSEVNLASGSIVKIDYFILPDCNIEKETVLLSVKNSYNVKKDYLVSVDPTKCQNLAAKLETSSLNIKPCEPIFLNLQVENVGNFPETYYFDLGKFDKYASSEFTSVLLYPTKKAEFNIKLQLACNIYGNFSIPLNVYSDTTNLGLNFENKIQVLPDYFYSLNLKENYFACSEEITSFDIQITNDNSFDDTYYLEFDKPAFISFEEKKLKLKAGESNSIKLIIDPKHKNLGNHTLVFHVKSKQSGIIKEFQANLSIDNCYNPQITELETKHSFCDGTPNIRFVVTNNAAKENTFILSMNKLSWIDKLFYASDIDTIKFTDNNFVLSPYSSKEVFIDISNIPSISAKYKLPIHLQIGGKPQTAEETVIIDYISAEQCHKISFSPDKKTINFDTEKMTFLIQNTGKQFSKYDIEFIPQAEYDFINIVPGDNFYTELGRTQKAYFGINFNTSQLSKESKDFTYDVIIKVNDSYRPTEYKYTLKIMQRDKSFVYYVGKWIYDNPVYDGIIIIVILLILLFLYLLLSRPKNIKHQDERKKNYKKVLIIYLSLLVLAFLILLLFFPLKSINPIITNDDTQFNHSLYSGSKKTIDIGNYFIDPDGDSLNYSAIIFASGDDDYVGKLPSVNFKEDLAIIKAPKNSEGRSSVFFKASDSINISKSSIFKVRTVLKPNYSLYEYVEFYLPYVIWFAIGLFVLIYVLAMYFWSKRKTQRQHLNQKKNILNNNKDNLKKNNNNKTNNKKVNNNKIDELD